jgi:transcriptional regulator with XRE-family HTH domain
MTMSNVTEGVEPARRTPYLVWPTRPAEAERRRQVAWRLKVMREELGLLKGEMARKLGVTPMRWGNYEAGIRLPTLEVLVAINERCGFSIDWLLGGGRNPKRAARTWLKTVASLDSIP